MVAELTPSLSVATKLHDKKVDEESQKVDSFQPDCSGPASDTHCTEDDQGLEDNSNVPKLSYPKLFWFFFYNFGLFAWGGPVAQIALIKERLVVQDKWITLPRFQRVFSVYQILPGPEAAELSGFENKYFNASFRALQPIVAAMILRATHKIADHSVRKHSTRKVDPFLVIAAICTAINGALRINICFLPTPESITTLLGSTLTPLLLHSFISLGLYGIIYTFIARRLWIPAAALFILQYVGYALYVVFRGVPSPVSLALGIAKTPSLINLFVLGLVAGTLSFGGAYTAIPFVQVEAVLMGAWLPQSVFIDGIAIGNILPAPLVIFATFVGFQGAYLDRSIGNAFAGAIIITLGMFFPCFLFTIAGHELLEKLVRNKFLASFFDGLCGSVIGVIAIIAAQILKASIVGSLERVKDKPIGEVIDTTAQVGPAAVLYMLALAVLYKFTNKYTALLLVIMGAVAGQFLFVD
ncbi:chromate transporter-domain-containing protein [Fusarium redolens]|uniref:Chromate transporter-domain-containing protein n=1 Tax=Fusarium redolens TaxID=48865 RepID=A0A9P9JP05_FUSRE|nr:chromate transporter-domain-containing protein [Fusarium redolens]KAH7231778.1 chromate transporter-domain-containing protein [Fusarium redolens]